MPPSSAFLLSSRKIDSLKSLGGKKAQKQNNQTFKSTSETLCSVSDLTALVKHQVAHSRLHSTQKTSVIKSSTKCCIKIIKCFVFSPGVEEWVYPVGESSSTQ